MQKINFQKFITYLCKKTFMYTNIILVFAMLFWFSCKNSAPVSSTTQPASVPPPDKGVVVDGGAAEISSRPNHTNQSSKNMPYRFMVSFISIGEGTDRQAKQILDSYLNEWRTNRGKEIHFEQVPWGREGEVDYCFPLVELDANQQKQFVNEMKAKFDGHNLVQFAENEPNRHKR